MRYLIIGLGSYGKNLAVNLSMLGHEVVGVDNRQSNLEDVKDKLASVYLLDCAQKSALDVLPLRHVDIAIVAIGEDFRASLRTVALLKKSGVKRIFARAIDELHESILQAFSIERILTPEKRAAGDLANELNFNSEVATFGITDDYLVSKISAPRKFLGSAYRNLNFSRFGLILIAAVRKKTTKNILGIVTEEECLLDIDRRSMEETVESGDTLVFVGSKQNFLDFAKKMSDSSPML